MKHAFKPELLNLFSFSVPPGLRVKRHLPVFNGLIFFNIRVSLIVYYKGVKILIQKH
jgi:hypothetical protein